MRYFGVTHRIPHTARRPPLPPGHPMFMLSFQNFVVLFLAEKLRLVLDAQQLIP
jgi:hypothetical protein